MALVNGPACTQPSSRRHSAGRDEAADSLYIREHYRKKEVRIPMRDGALLFTSLYIPRDTSVTYPVILMRTPYSVGPYGEDKYRMGMYPSMLEAHEGFIFAYQDVRGRYMSEGKFVDVRPYLPAKRGRGDVDESSDTYDTIDWIIGNVRTSGKVGISGISYPGFYTTMGILDAHPALSAASPQAPIADWFIGDDDHHNGAMFLAETFGFFVNFGRPRPEPTTRSSGWFHMPTPDAYTFFLRMGPLANAERLYMRDSIAYWKDLMGHPNYDSFWQARAVLPHLKNIRPAVMTVGGWFDKEDLYGALNTYKTIEKNNPGTVNILVMGPWSHGQWNRDDGERLGDIEFSGKTSVWFREHVQTPFFSYYLKGKGSGTFAEATVFETGANRWHQLPAWPPREAREKKLYLHDQGALAFIPPSLPGDAFTAFTSDPAKPVPFSAETAPYVRPSYMVEDQRFAATRPDVILFQSAPLTEPVTLAGPLTATLYVSTTGTDADWVVKLIDVFPDDTTAEVPSSHPLGGYQMLVRGDVFRGKFRRSFEKPEPFIPGRVTEVTYTMPDIFHTFKAGHRMMIQIQSSWFPLVDRNPQTFVNILEATEGDFIRAEHRVYHSAVHPSALTVLVWEGP
jgi:hypothetical protein